MPAATVVTWEKATGGYRIDGYGPTETSPIGIGNPFGPSRKPGTVGVPFPLTDIRVVDPKNVALDRAPGEEGELLIRGPQMFGGYWNRPEDTEDALVDGGWFRTGDIVSVDDDYFNVSPSEVEDVIATFPAHFPSTFDHWQTPAPGDPGESCGEGLRRRAIYRFFRRRWTRGLTSVARSVIDSRKCSWGSPPMSICRKWRM